MLSCEAIPDTVPGLSPSGRTDGRSMRAVWGTGSLDTPGFGPGIRHAREQFARLPRRQPPPAAPDADEHRSAGLTDTRNAQPALGIAGYAPAGLSVRAEARPWRGGDAR